MNIQVATEKTDDGKLLAKVTVPAADVDKAIAATYADIARRYSFQGFRKGHVPRPVIDGMIGRDAVLGETTNTVLGQVDPQLCEELNVVPLGEISYGDDVQPVVGGQDYVVEATIAVRPECELTDYDAPAIDMPPAEPTEAEVDEQIDVLQGYHATFDDVEEDREVAADDIVSIDVEDVENAAAFAGEGRMLDMGGAGMPAEFDEQLVGMRKGESREVAWTEKHAHGEHEHEVARKVKVTLVAIKQRNVPELTEEFIKESYGFDSVEQLRDAVRQELATDKTYTLPNVKENRVVAAVAEKLDLDEVPEDYQNSVYTEVLQEFLQQLQRQGTTVDAYLQARGVDFESFLADVREQADERARQSLALDAVARHLGLEVSEDELAEEFGKSGVEDPEASLKEFRDAGRLPAVREALLRNKALNWLVENATVTEVDEAAQRRADAE